MYAKACGVISVILNFLKYNYAAEAIKTLYLIGYRKIFSLSPKEIHLIPILHYCDQKLLGLMPQRLIQPAVFSGQVSNSI